MVVILQKKLFTNRKVKRVKVKGTTDLASRENGSRDLQSELFSTLAMSDRYTFFYTKSSPFSQFHPCDFEEDGIKFTAAEQYMMYQKAVLFNDHDVAQQILYAENPMQMKKLGRQVSGFRESVWIDNRERIVSQGNYLKFTQNSTLKQRLLATGNTILVEASPSDKIWGVGLRETDPLIHDKNNWKGLNLLGKILTEVREKIKAEQ